MRPVLLARPEIDKRKAEERRQQLDEGLRIAEQVDTLREVRASEENALLTYRTHELRETQLAIDTLKADIEKLQEERTTTRKEWATERERMYGNLDTQWVTYVKTEKARMESLIASNLKREQELLLQKSKEDERAKELETRTRTLESENRKVQALFASAEVKLQEAKTTGEDAHNKAHVMLAQAQAREKEIAARNQKSEEREQYIAIKEKEMKKLQQSIEEREWKVKAKELQFYSPVKQL